MAYRKQFERVNSRSKVVALRVTPQEHALYGRIAKKHFVGIADFLETAINYYIDKEMKSERKLHK